MASSTAESVARRIGELLSDGRWRTSLEIASGKHGGIGTRRVLVEEALRAFPTAFRERSGYEASGRSGKARLWELIDPTALPARGGDHGVDHEPRVARIASTDDGYSLPYSLYISSPGWARRRERALAEALNRCQVCYAGDDGGEAQRLDVHHRTYERLGHELPTDVIVLCSDCHDLFHKHGRLVRAGNADVDGVWL